MANAKTFNQYGVRYGDILIVGQKKADVKEYVDHAWDNYEETPTTPIFRFKIKDFVVQGDRYEWNAEYKARLRKKYKVERVVLI